MDNTTTPPAVEAVKPMPFTEKLANIFASPGELYDNIRDTPQSTSNWLIPTLIFLVVSIVMNLVMMSNPSIADQIGQMMRKGIDEQVTQGKITSAQAEQSYEMMRPGSTMFTILAMGGTLVMTFASLFGLGLVYWLVGKGAMSATAPYMKVVEVIGLTFFIGTLEVVITTVLIIGFDRLNAGPSAAFFVTDFNPTDKIHMLLSKVNLFTFWSLAVTSIGLSRLFRKDFPKVLVLVLALWILWTVITVFAGCAPGR
jgi:hypothetical protein